MRSDERTFFWLTAGALTVSLLFTTFWCILPELEHWHRYQKGHCTITGKGHWEKYETPSGIRERVIVPVELRMGGVEGMMEWNSGSTIGASDKYYRAIARDEPSGWEFFSRRDKWNYLQRYPIGSEFRCSALPGEDLREVVLHQHHVRRQIVPQVVLVCILIFLCMATGICLGLVDNLCACMGLAPMQDLKQDEISVGGFADEKSAQWKHFSGRQARDNFEWV